MPYVKQTWLPGPSGGTPLSAARLNHMEDGIALVAGVADTTAPSAPQSLVLGTPSDTAVTGTWDAATDDVGVTGYILYRVEYPTGGGTETVVTPVLSLGVAARSGSLTGLNPLSPYGFRVTALDAAGHESDFTEVAFSTAAKVDFTAPTVPTGLYAVVVGATNMPLAWNASTDTESGVVFYRLYQGTGSGYVDLTTPIASPVDTTYTVPGLTPNTPYKWRVSAVDGAGNESTPGAAFSVTTLAGTDTTNPSQVTGVGYSGVQSNRLNLAWLAATDNSGVIASYNIHQGIGSVAGATPIRTHDHEGTVATTPTGPAESYDSRTGANVAYVGTAQVGTTSLRFDGAALTYFDDVAIGSGTLVWSGYIRLESLSTIARFCGARAGATSVANVDIGTTGLVRIANGSNTLLASSTAALSVNTWYLIEAKFSNGTCTVRLFTAAGSLITTVTSNATTSGVPDALRTGLRAVGPPVLIDRVRVAPDWITSTSSGTTYLATVPGSQLNYAVSGLSPSTLYAFQISAVDPSNNEGTKSLAVTPTTAPGQAKQIIYGLNTRPDATNSLRLGDRTAANNWVSTAGQGLYEIGIGMSRCYYDPSFPGGLPATFDIPKTTGGFGSNKAKRVNVCWKGDANPQSIINGNFDVRLMTWVNSIPDDWEVAATWFHEPNKELSLGQFTAAAYKNAHRRIGALLDGRVPDAAAGGAKTAGTPSLALNPGVKVYSAVCYTIWRGSGSNQWTSCQPSIPNAADMDANAILLLDAYQNTPPGGTGVTGSLDQAAGADWTSLYPTGSQVWSFYFANVHTVYGYDAAGHGYGVGEWMAPARLHDGNVNMGGTDDPTKPWQALAVEDYLAYLEARTQTPRMVLFWENPASVGTAGASFPQRAFPKARKVFTNHALGQYAI